jgi:hypothetical protein
VLFYTHCSSTERETPDQVGVGEGSLRVLNIDNQHSAGNQRGPRWEPIHSRAAFGRVSGLPVRHAVRVRPPVAGGVSAAGLGRPPGRASVPSPRGTTRPVRGCMRVWLSIVISGVSRPWV